MDTDFINKYMEKLAANMNNVTNQFIMLEARYELLQEQNAELAKQVEDLEKKLSKKSR